MSHHQKCHVPPHFNYCDQRNGMIPLTIPLVPHDPGSMGITWPKSQVSVHFDHCDLRNAVVPLTMLPASHDADISTNDKKAGVLS